MDFALFSSLTAQSGSPRSGGATAQPGGEDAQSGGLADFFKALDAAAREAAGNTGAPEGEVDGEVALPALPADGEAAPARLPDAAADALAALLAEVAAAAGVAGIETPILSASDLRQPIAAAQAVAELAPALGGVTAVAARVLAIVEGGEAPAQILPIETLIASAKRTAEELRLPATPTQTPTQTAGEPGGPIAPAAPETKPVGPTLAAVGLDSGPPAPEANGATIALPDAAPAPASREIAAAKPFTAPVLAPAEPVSAAQRHDIATEARHRLAGEVTTQASRARKPQATGLPVVSDTPVKVTVSRPSMPTVVEAPNATPAPAKAGSVVLGSPFSELATSVSRAQSGQSGRSEPETLLAVAPAAEIGDIERPETRVRPVAEPARAAETAGRSAAPLYGSLTEAGSPLASTATSPATTPTSAPSAAPAAATAAAQPTEAGRALVPQIASAIAAQQAPGRIDVQLDPPELGRIEITLDIADSGLRATLSAERAGTGDMIRRHAELMLQQLQDAGFSDVDLRFGDSQRDARDDSERPEFRGQTADGATAETAPVRVATATETGLDLRL
ncbi:MAG: flagellar hook-length control protein FliK [Pseudomonadota bacterium]